MWETRVTKLLNIEFPIIQGGLAYLAYAELAAAVSNAGGLGQITAMSLEDPFALTMEIRKVKERTDRPFGVNFAIGQHGRPFEHFVEAALKEGVGIMSVTGGNPVPFFKMLEGTEVKKLVLVAARRQAQKAEELGADAVMAVGHEGGGHLGKSDTGTMVLIPQVVDAVSIPVIASGGIGDGRGLMAALSLGAEGIEMGTRFIATRECIHAHPLYKEALIKGSEDDTVVIKRTLGAPARAISNGWTQKLIEMEQRGTSYDEVKDMISGYANKRFIHEGQENGFAWAGQVMGMIRDVPSAAGLIEVIMKEAGDIRRKWAE
ncbi:NAD(P)H-dependent flavin oxidoreductase [Peribacillus sp. SCS-26]|uniref:NAD(P)H-dependent flavin oxidoreductase n=1 Tax=Paraperibacillus marinus TaxID=3115295 RepID=UPI003905D82F